MGRITRVKSFAFRRPDGVLIYIPVPKHWDQTLIPRISRGGYSVRTLVTASPPPEASFSPVLIESKSTNGYLIPGSAILSPDTPHHDDAYYCAYNIIAADVICRSSLNGEYRQASKNCVSATSRDLIFHQDLFYLITWDSQIPAAKSFDKDYSISLCSNGLVGPNDDGIPGWLCTSHNADRSPLRIKKSLELPDYAITILCSLVPNAVNPFLRFFYLYQIVEYLMGRDFDSRITGLRQDFLTNQDPSMVELREIVKKFQKAANEETRINSALDTACIHTSAAADALLDKLNIADEDLTFAGKIYRVRNTLFHDYRRLHDYDSEVSSLCQNLYSYLLARLMPS